MKRTDADTFPSAKAAVLALAEIKAASGSFDRGEINVIDALKAIAAAIQAARRPSEYPRAEAA